MTMIVNVQEAKTRLSELLRLVEAGEDVEIARAGHVIASLHAVNPVKRSFERPLLPSVQPFDASELLAPLAESELAEWEEGHIDDPLTGEDSAREPHAGDTRVGDAEAGAAGDIGDADDLGTREPRRGESAR